MICYPLDITTKCKIQSKMQDAKQTNQPEKLYEGAGCGFQINWKFQEDYPSFFLSGLGS